MNKYKITADIIIEYDESLGPFCRSFLECYGNRFKIKEIIIDSFNNSEREIIVLELIGEIRE